MPIPYEKMFFVEHKRTQVSRRCLIPRKCYISGKSIWLKRCEVITHKVKSLTETTVFEAWCDPQQLTLAQLKG